MNDQEHGYTFALPRLLARSAGRPVRRAEWSAAEIFGFGLFVFLLVCLIAGRGLFLFVRPGWWWLAVGPLLPLAVWIGFLLVYSLNFLIAQALRSWGIYSARTNNPFQHFVIMSGLTFLAFLLLRDPNGFMRSLGIFWLALVGLNLFSLLILKLLHEE